MNYRIFGGFMFGCLLATVLDLILTNIYWVPKEEAVKHHAAVWVTADDGSTTFVWRNEMP